MQNLKDLTKKESQNKELEIEFNKSMEDKIFANLVSKLKTPKQELMKHTTKLNETCQELKNCKNCKGLYACKNSLEGHVSGPKIVNNKLIFTYLPCKYYKKLLEKETEDKKLSKITMKDIDTLDKKQLKVIKWMDDFYSKFDLTTNLKGLYLHGSFGSGKTYLLTALLNELEQSKGASTLIVYFPDVLRELKEDFDSMSYKMYEFMHVDILLIDDIGAEKVTDWGRDEILGTILQSRMNNKKITFFTSNLTINELESHLSITGSGVDKVKSRRIVERIKQLTTDLELVSENRRN